MSAAPQSAEIVRPEPVGTPLSTAFGRPETARAEPGKAEANRPVRVVMPEAAPAAPSQVPPPAIHGPPKAVEAGVAAKPKSWRKRLILGALLLTALGVGGTYARDWYTTGRFQVSTNDAFVKTDMATLGAKISGYVAGLPVAENGEVKAGDVVLKLDDGDYRLAVEAATGRVETQKAVIDGISRQIDAQAAEIAAADARVTEAAAAVANADSTLARTKKLINNAVVSKQSLDDAVQRRDEAGATLAQMKASLVAAKAQTAVWEAKRIEAGRLVAELQTAVAKAERDLSFTEIRAPFDGIVANRAVEFGQYVQGGARLMVLVPVKAAYIEANFKETEIAEVRRGQKVQITVDAFAGKTFVGSVDSLAPASGAEFSLLPPENATGNFTKITQRVPVKIRVPAELAALLRPGLSVFVSVDTRDAGS